MKLTDYLKKFNSSKEFNSKEVAKLFKTSVATVTNTFYLIQKKRKSDPTGEAFGADMISELNALLIDTQENSTHISSSKSSKIKTLDDLIAAANINLDTHKVTRHVINKWEMGKEELWQVKAWLAPIKDEEQIKTEGFLKQALIETIENYVEYVPKLDSKFYGNMLEISIPDLHLGKYSIFDETQQIYNRKVAQDRYLKSVTALVDKASKSYKLDKVLLVIGNDFLNSDGLSKGTTKGTPQDNDMRYTEMFKTGLELIIKAVEICYTTSGCTDIEVITVSGNHDEQAMYYLGVALDAFYTFNTNVGVNSSATMRKYYRYGKTLLGYTHGDSEKHDKLPLIMATEEPKLWAETFFHEWHVGHFHKNKTDEYNGVIVHTLPSLSGPDYWHYKQGYTGGKPQAIGSVYNFDNGPVAKFIHTCFS